MKGRNVTIPGGQRGQSRMMHAVLRGIAGLCLCLLGVSAQGQSGAGQSPSVPLSAENVTAVTTPVCPCSVFKF